MKRLSLLGSTGSIGRQALDVLRCLRGTEKEYRVSVLAARGKNLSLLEEQAREFAPQAVALFDEDAAKEFRLRTRDLSLTVLSGLQGLQEAAAWADSDLVLNAVVGMIGLRPTLAALSAGKPVALANKETLVAGGALVTALAKEKGLPLLPVDSEHSAIFQCLQASPGHDAVKKLILTASGGPFFGKSRQELAAVTPQMALRHPNWSMGAKVTIDSATMMNKGLEIMEAGWLFDMPQERIHVVVHRESIVHSLIQFQDNSVLAQLGLPDMRIPIQYAMSYPARCPSPVGELDLNALGQLCFAPPDEETFRCLALCRQAMARGGLVPAAANGANEAAVELFLNGKIGFLEIPQLVEAAMAAQPDAPADSLDAVLEADRRARALANELAGK